MPLSNRSKLGDADGWWLEARCPACERQSLLPCRLLAQELAPQRTLGDVMARLICRACSVRPSAVDLVERPDADAVGFVGGPARRIRLVGR